MKTTNLLCAGFVSFMAVSFNSYAQDQGTPDTNLKIMEEPSQLNELHTDQKPLSIKILFKGEEGVTRSLQLKKDGVLPEHTTPTPAVLICVLGKVSYEDESGYQVILEPGDFQKIEVNIKHWVKGLDESQLLLIK